MTKLLRHRGPDNQNCYQGRFASLGHARLSIIDLSPLGDQPMCNEDGSIHLVCNGEIYNYVDLKEDLRARGHVFRSGSDNEVLIHLYEQYGEDMLQRVNGMYAFALWDENTRTLLAAVDRFGKKPLYYALDSTRLAFASELKSLLLLPWVKRDVDPLAIDRYLSLRYVPAPLSLFKSVRKLPPASLMIWKQPRLSIQTYWKPRPQAICDYHPRTVDQFQELLADAVRVRLQSEVPLGLYLSGGVDSAAVGSLMQRMIAGPKVSYGVGFNYAYDERPRARRIAEHLGFEFNSVTVTGREIGWLPRIAYHLDEPMGDLLCLPAYVLAQKAKKKLTVVLTGDGADEILGGYFHQRLMMMHRRGRGFFSVLGPAASRMLRAVPCAVLNRFFDYPDSLGPRERLKLAQSLANAGTFGDFYEHITSCFTPADKKDMLSPDFTAQVQAPPLAREFQSTLDQAEGFGFLSRLSLLDLKYWIPFSVIYRLDKMNMAHAVETRSPFLDYRLVEMALNLPEQAKLGKQRNKEILRSLMERLYPPKLVEKGKQAFYMPLTDPYRDHYLKWLHLVLNPRTVAGRGMFDWNYIKKHLYLARKGSMLASRQLTALAMLEMTLQVFQDFRPGEATV